MRAGALDDLQLVVAPTRLLGAAGGLLAFLALAMGVETPRRRTHPSTVQSK